MIILVCALLLAMLIIWSVRTMSAAQSSASFFVNNRSSASRSVALSIIASCVGGSATLGMTGLAWQVGTPAFWWLGSGAVGLLILTLCLARKVRQSGAQTMPEILTTFLGAPARPLAAAIILLAWLAILAAQFAALAAIIQPLLDLPQLGRTPILSLGAACIILYSMAGGQAAVIKSDCVQFILMLAALSITLIYILMQHPMALSNVKLELINSNFPLSKLSYFMCILGGSYVVCPMLFGRLLSAKDAHQARQGGLWAVIGLTLTAILIVALGLACRSVVAPDTAPEAVLSTVMLSLPPWLASLLLLGLACAILSSADSCLVTAATVCCNDILQSTHLRTCRLATVALGLGGLLLALSQKGILALLLMANDIYVCGVVVPVFVGMVLHKRYTFQPNIMALAMLLGGALGLTSALTDNHYYSYAGLIAALIISLSAARLVRYDRSAPDFDLSEI